MLKKEKKKVTDFLSNPNATKPPINTGNNMSSLNSTITDDFAKPKRQIRKLTNLFS